MSDMRLGGGNLSVEDDAGQVVPKLVQTTSIYVRITVPLYHKESLSLVSSFQFQ